MIKEQLIADVLFSLGTLVGLAHKGNALKDQDTQWPRASSILQISTYPITAFLPMLIMEMWVTLTTFSLNFLLWLGIYLYRAPEEEDWLGRKPGETWTGKFKRFTKQLIDTHDS